ncbi:MFS transporter [Nocardioides bizhenqiangii]|uniref:MFS transporter n=1 Tax=Nocardioides bizhenqiangii TaxID=3095076 RepID=A0ABZ0ZL37_9ACTN|nr:MULTISPECIES: MFS transporter [unclassified Nocardioides]MDZ5620547.1 MFS transporter [Nocardioides sp. HM23]WQQ24918.1 MFS transporter [Nocardioides sp. HM61]
MPAVLSGALAPYRHIFTPATSLFSLTGLVARLPISMVGLGIVLLAEHETGSYAFAGAVSATALLAQAGFAVVQGRLLDRLGQSRVLPLLITLWGAGLAAMMLSLKAEWPVVTTYVLAAVAGAALPSVGTCVRARWSHCLKDDPSGLHTAFSFEAVADEAVYLLGPIIVTMLATAVDPVAGLGAALAFGLVGTFVFAGLRSTEPPVHPAPTAGTQRPAMPWIAVGALSVLTFALGVLFGAAEVSTVAFSEEEGQQGAAGFLLAIWALGSLVAGLISGAISWRQGPLVRMRWGALGMAAAMAPLVLVPSVPLMALVLLVGGFAISPTLIAAMSLAEQVLPPARLTEGMMLLQTGIALGLAPGAALAGVVIEESGASAAYLVSFGGGVLALAAALATRLPQKSRQIATPETQPDPDRSRA